MTIRTIIIAVVAVMAAACSRDDKYSVEVTGKGLGTQNVTLVYIADDAVHTSRTTALNDAFAFSGKLDAPALMTLYANSGAPLARLIVMPGDKIRLTLDTGDFAASTVEGSEATARLLEVLRGGVSNSAIARYVGEHPDDPVSAILVTEYYDIAAGSATAADSLLSLVGADARSVAAPASYAALLRQATPVNAKRLPATIKLRTLGADSARVINLRHRRRTLLAIQDIDTRPDLHRALDAAGLRVTANDIRLVEYTIAADSAQWAVTLANDTLPGTWTHAYSPAGIMDLNIKPLGIPTVPYYILADSTGRILLSTSSPVAALRAL